MFCLHVIKANTTYNVAVSVIYVISQIVTLALLEVNLCLVITVLFQEIQTVKFGFRTSGDSILLEFLLLDAHQTKLKLPNT